MKSLQTKPDGDLYDYALQFLDIYLHGDKFTEASIFLPCRDAIAAMMWLESARGTSVLARTALNLFGLKYRQEIAGPKRWKHQYQDWEKLADCYFAFSSLEECVCCFFDFIDREIYSGELPIADDPEDFATDPEGLVKFLVGRGFCASLPNMPEGVTKHDEYWRRCKAIIDSGRIPQMITADF